MILRRRRSRSLTLSPALPLNNSSPQIRLSLQGEATFPSSVARGKVVRGFNFKNTSAPLSLNNSSPQIRLSLNNSIIQICLSLQGEATFPSSVARGKVVREFNFKNISPHPNPLQPSPSPDFVRPFPLPYIPLRGREGVKMIWLFREREY